MNCKDCEKAQKEYRQGKAGTYLRIDHANILVLACEKHFDMVTQTIYEELQKSTVKRPDMNERMEALSQKS